MSFDLVLFGGTGDLTWRKLMPALFQAFRHGKLPPGGRILAVARDEHTDDRYRAWLKERFQEVVHEKRPSEEEFERFAQLVHYRRMDLSQPEHYARLKEWLQERNADTVVLYLATSPHLFPMICEQLGAGGLNDPHIRVVLEKPLGHDLASAQEINRVVRSVFSETQAFRIDHYLGKPSVQNLMALRFGNALFEPLWRRESIANIQITLAEDIGVGTRGDFYDRTGALRDMIQSQAVQLLTMVAMEPPSSSDADAIRDEKLKVLRALKRFTPNSLVQNVVRGQYKSGHVNGVAVPGYRKEPDANTQSRTETFVAVKAEIDTWRWSGVPFYLRTGKRMADSLAEIVVRFKSIPHSIFNQPISSFQPNSLVIRLQPDEGLNLNLMAKTPGDGMRLKLVDLELDFRETFKKPRMEAYERLLMDVLRGQLTLFMRSDELEAAWEWVEPILHFWDQEDNDPLFYTSGSWGPGAASALIGRDGLQWREEALPED